MVGRLRRWLLARLLGPDAYTLQPMPVQAGDFIVLRAKNPDRTSNHPQRVEVTKVRVSLHVDVRYRDGSTTGLIYTPSDLLLAKQAARG